MPPKKNDEWDQMCVGAPVWLDPDVCDQCVLFSDRGFCPGRKLYKGCRGKVVTDRGSLRSILFEDGHEHEFGDLCLALRPSHPVTVWPYMPPNIPYYGYRD